jgi:hypothetical protein
LSAIAERRSNSGEDTEDEDEAGEGGWKAADVRAPIPNPADGSVLKAGYLWKKGERRKVCNASAVQCTTCITPILFACLRHGRNAGSSFGLHIWRTTRRRKNINYFAFWK